MKTFTVIILCWAIALLPAYARRWVPKIAAPGGGGPTLLIDEGFEGTDTPTSWFSGGTFDFDSTASPLVGAQSLRISANSSYGGYPSALNWGKSEIYVKFRFRAATLPASNGQIFTLTESGGFNTVLAVTLLSTGSLAVGDYTSSVFETTTDTLSANTEYDIEIHYSKGTGANGILSVGFVAAGGSIPTTGTKFAGATNSNMTANADFFQCLVGLGGGFTADFDTVQAAAAFIP